ncbi:hypothetical protein ACV34O_32235, partial [Pseudomonas aeruginosa]
IEVLVLVVVLDDLLESLKDRRVRHGSCPGANAPANQAARKVAKDMLDPASSRGLLAPDYRQGKHGICNGKTLEYFQLVW